MLASCNDGRRWNLVDAKIYNCMEKWKSVKQVQLQTFFKNIDSTRRSTNAEA